MALTIVVPRGAAKLKKKVVRKKRATAKRDAYERAAEKTRKKLGPKNLAKLEKKEKAAGNLSVVLEAYRYTATQLRRMVTPTTVENFREASQDLRMALARNLITLRSTMTDL